MIVWVCRFNIKWKIVRLRIEKRRRKKFMNVKINWNSFQSVLWAREKKVWCSHAMGNWTFAKLGMVLLIYNVYQKLEFIDSLCHKIFIQKKFYFSKLSHSLRPPSPKKSDVISERPLLIILMKVGLWNFFVWRGLRVVVWLYN